MGVFKDGGQSNTAALTNMSDNPDKCSIKLQVEDPVLLQTPTIAKLVELLKTLTEWEDFAIYLLEHGHGHVQQEIAKQNLSVKSCKIAIFGEWLKRDPSASWKKVVTALEKAEQHTLAKTVTEAVRKSKCHLLTWYM